MVACLRGLPKALGSVPSTTEQANKSVNGEESASSVQGGRITHPETSRTCRPLVRVGSAVGQSARDRLIKPPGLDGHVNKFFHPWHLHVQESRTQRKDL